MNHPFFFFFFFFTAVQFKIKPVEHLSTFFLTYKRKIKIKKHFIQHTVGKKITVTAAQKDGGISIIVSWNLYFVNKYELVMSLNDHILFYFIGQTDR